MMKTDNYLFLLALGFVGMLSPAIARESNYQTISQTVRIPMRDGVELATDIYLPSLDGMVAPGKFPTILARTPYGRTTSAQLGAYLPADAVQSPAWMGETSMAAYVGGYYASRGYAFVAQDVRGRYDSDGRWSMLNDDGRDGWDCAAWIGRQAWSDGKIGMIGGSYTGGTQHAMALEGVPQLATVVPADAMSNMGRQSVRYAGAFELRFWNWVMDWSARGSQPGRDPGTAQALGSMSRERLAYLPHLPLRRGTTPLKWAPEYEEWLVEAMQRGVDDAFWATNNILSRPTRYKDMPVYLIGGWYDSWAGNTTANFVALSQAIQGPVYLIMGPWAHSAQNRSSHGQVSFGPEAVIADPLAWRLEWYDRWLKGIENSVGRSAPFATKVRIFVMGTGDGRRTDDGLLDHGGYWRDEREWPLARARMLEYYLHSGGGLAPKKPSAGAANTSFEFDPRQPVPTIGGQVSSHLGLMQQGAWDQRGAKEIWNWPEPVPLSARNDVVVFQSAPLKHDLEVTGEIEVRLWASSSAVDTDFTAKLVDVYPPSTDFPQGFDLIIGDGIVRARFRESLQQEKLMNPGTIYPLTIKLYPTSNVFKRGHRIRVDISSSNFPRFDVNPNTGEPLNEHRRVATALNTIYHDRDRPSHIVLPIIPADSR